jgi:hypothetical protein
MAQGGVSMSERVSAVATQPVQWSYISGKAYDDPFSAVDLDVLFVDVAGHEWRVPAFWAGDMTWCVRFAPPHTGTFQFRTVCSDATNSDLHDHRGLLEAGPYRGENPLFVHGGLRVSEDARHLQHSDGMPFFWLADTWWMALSKRLVWPDEFQLLVEDRKRKGFTVIQLVAGLFPDMAPLDTRSANEAGLAWTSGFAQVRPAYFDMADLRIQFLVRMGLVPCIVGCWGYYLPFMGVEAARLHWRHIVARYAAYPVVWCVAGEAAMPYYLSTDRKRDRASQVAGWSTIARYVRQTDPFRRPLTVHPTDASRNQIDDASVLDFEMLQTGHGGHESIANTVEAIVEAVARPPRMPVVSAEVCYEGIFGGSHEEVQRIVFWASLLSGAAGHTYGANGLWQFNRRELPFGPSPHGASWGNTSWDEAMGLPGSVHVGIGKAILERFAWWRLEPHSEWVEPCAGPHNYKAAYAAGIPGEVRLFYFPTPICPWSRPVLLKALEADTTYEATWVDPRTGADAPLGTVTPNPDGQWRVPYPPTLEDWVLVLQSTAGTARRA